MKRRHFILSAGALAACARAWAAPSVPLLGGGMPSAVPSGAPPEPYSNVPLRKEDSRRVLVFFAFSCPVCRQMHGPLANWAATLPAAVEFEFVPVLEERRDSIVAARAWYAMASVAPRKLWNWAGIVYSLVHDRGMPLGEPNTWILAAREAGVPGFVDAWKRVPADHFERVLTLMKHYRVTVTPTMAIAGKTVVNPDNVNGDFNLFLQLANGIISREILS